jgi:excisionase family DNA binding protein
MTQLFNYLTVEKAAECLGVTRRTLYDFIKKCIIKTYKPRRKIYISIEELQRYIESRDGEKR